MKPVIYDNCITNYYESCTNKNNSFINLNRYPTYIILKFQKLSILKD